MEFKASKSLWLLTVTVFVLGGLVLLALWIYFTGGDVSALASFGSIVIFISGLSYYFSISKYRLTDTAIIIVRPFDTVTYPRNIIERAERVDKSDLYFAIRTFGIGGVFAYTGQFWNRKFGNMTWYVTRMDCAVMLYCRNKKILVSPDEPEAFIAALTANCHFCR